MAERMGSMGAIQLLKNLLDDWRGRWAFGGIPKKL